MVAIQEVEHRAAMEDGLIVPAPGEETAWLEQHRDRPAELGLTGR